MNIICDADCQQQKATTELYDKYMSSKNNLDTAPVMYNENRKNYLVYTQGDSYYQNVIAQEYSATANQNAQDYQSEMDTVVALAEAATTTYETAQVNAETIQDLYNSLYEKNDVLKHQVDETGNAILTNDRKTSYQMDSTETLSNWMYLYYFLFYGLVVVLIWQTVQKGVWANMGVIVVLILYPYLIDYLIHYLKMAWKYVVSFVYPE